MARPKATYVDTHDVKLYIINNPSIRNQELIAHKCGVKRNTVINALNELNIPQRSKPLNYVG